MKKLTLAAATAAFALVANITGLIKYDPKPLLPGDLNQDTAHHMLDGGASGQSRLTENYTLGARTAEQMVDGGASGLPANAPAGGRTAPQMVDGGASGLPATRFNRRQTL